jgi:hypothetical protein
MAKINVGNGLTIEVSADKKKATLEIDLTGNLGPSGSGKSIGIAGTGGNVTIPDTDLKLGLNVYRPVKKAA